MGKTILVAMTDLFFYTKVRDALREPDYRLEKARTQQDIVDKAAAANPSVIIFNMNDLTLDAFRALEKLKTDSRLKDIPTLAFANHEEVETWARAKALGVTKVVSRNEFSARTKDLVEEIIATRPAQSPPDTTAREKPFKRSQLHVQHGQLGALFEEITGWEMPAHYGDIEDEHRAVRQAVGIADLSHRGKIRVTGEDRVKWLQSVISNDILPLQPGQGRYSSLLTHKGKMLTYFRLYLQTEAVMLEDVGEIGDATFQTLRKFLLYGTKAKMENCTESWGLLLISGPKAPQVMHAGFGVDVTDLQPLDFVTAQIGGRHALIIRTEETGEVDIEILLPADNLATAWKHAMQAGAKFGIKAIGAQAREALRVEAGLPKAGLDLNEEIVPPEANLEGKAFSLSKGCYPGQEVVARMDTYGTVRRRLVGLVLHDSTVPSKEAKLFSGDREVGWISSAVRSPQLNKVIAFGFPLRDFSAPDTALTVEVDGTRHEATVHSLPFYSRV
jgi:glycine cleavage system T protein